MAAVAIRAVHQGSSPRSRLRGDGVEESRALALSAALVRIRAAMLTPEDEKNLKIELLTVRDAGLIGLRQLSVPTLSDAARRVTFDAASTDHVVVEALLRRAVARLGGGKLGDAAAAYFGLGDTRVENSRVRREEAAAALEKRFETFRKAHERALLGEVIAQIGVLVSEQQTREARAERQGSRAMEESALPQLWHDRFTVYHRIWTALNGLGNDLTAYRETLLDEKRRWDRRFGTEGEHDQGYLQEEQAQGYALYALYHYATYSWELRGFLNSHGGQWLLSNPEAEATAADAVHRIWRASPWNERDDSYLRTLLDQTPNRELHHFIDKLRSTKLGQATEAEWHTWCEQCACIWPRGAPSEKFFPTRMDHSGISADCPLHETVDACGVYLTIVEQDWKNLADWYRNRAVT